MFPTINKKETGVNLRRIMDMRGVKPKDLQEYLGFGCVQSVYRWLDGVSMPTVDNLYAISKMLQVPMDSIVCGNAGRTKSQMDGSYVGDSIDYEEQFMTSQVYECILVRVILKLLRYEGNYIDYGTIGYPEKNINCPSGSEVGETP